MTVYIVCGREYDEINEAFVTENIAVYTDEQRANALVQEAQAYYEHEGYLSNYYWVETWEVK